jgi:DNA-binding PadR family transcriptional regulator
MLAQSPEGVRNVAAELRERSLQSYIDATLECREDLVRETGVMTERAFLGEFEHLVLAAALRLKAGYGAELVRELEERTGRQVQGGALYITLDRLEQKGYVVSRMGEPDPKRGGRPKRFVEVTASGVRALAEHREALLRIWDGLEATLGDA